MKRLTISFILAYSVVFAENGSYLSKEKLNLLIKQNVPDYCSVLDKVYLIKKKNQFGRVVNTEMDAWLKVLFDRTVSKKDKNDKKKEVMKLLSFVTYIINNKFNYVKNEKMYLIGLNSYLKSSLGVGTIPIYEFNVKSFSSKHMKIAGRITYPKLGILLAKQLILQSKDKEDYVDRMLLFNAYLITYAFNTTTLVEMMSSPFFIDIFEHRYKKIEKKFMGLYDKTTNVDMMISFYLNLLIKNLNNPKINMLIYHFVKGDAVSFMLKDEKVYKNYKFMKDIYLYYKKAHKC